MIKKCKEHPRTDVSYICPICKHEYCKKCYDYYSKKCTFCGTKMQMIMKIEDDEDAFGN
jgi:tRNA G26 N,N-dimethylase Trm1